MSDFETKNSAAERIWVWANQLKTSAQIAKTKVTSNDYEEALNMVSFIIRLGTESARLQAKGWSAAVLGPVIFDLVDGAPTRSWAANYDTGYAAFKAALSQYAGHMITVGTYGVTLHPSTGDIKFNVPVDQNVKDTILANLQNIIDTLPVVGG